MLRILLASLLLSLFTIGALAQDKGGRLTIGDTIYKFDPLSEANRKLLTEFESAVGQTATVRGSTGAYWCTGEYCACVGEKDCYLMKRSRVCREKGGDDLSCGPLSTGRIGCHCTSSAPPIDTDPIDYSGAYAFD